MAFTLNPITGKITFGVVSDGTHDAISIDLASQFGVSEDFKDNFTLGIADFSDDFSGVDNWADQGTKIEVNTATDVIDFDGSMGGTIESTAFDLGAGVVSDTEWTLRFKIDVTATAFTTSNVSLRIGLSDSDQTVSHGASHDSINIEYNVQNTTGVRRYVSRAIEGIVSFGNSASWLTGFGLTTHFVEIKRTSSTSVTLNVYSDSSFSTLIGTDTFTIPATTSDSTSVENVASLYIEVVVCEALSLTSSINLVITVGVVANVPSSEAILGACPSGVLTLNLLKVLSCVSRNRYASCVSFEPLNASTSDNPIYSCLSTAFAPSSKFVMSSLNLALQFNELIIGILFAFQN